MSARHGSLAFSLLGLIVTGCGHSTQQVDDARFKQAEYECYRDSAPGPNVTGSPQGGAVGATLQTAANAQRRASYARCMESGGYGRSDKPAAGAPSAPAAPPVPLVSPPGPPAPSPSTSLVDVDLPTRQAWCNNEMKSALGPSLANAAKPMPADLEAQYSRFLQACLAHG